MNTNDFLDVAGELKDHPKEAFIRTSISRSYYGVFLYFRDFLKTGGLSFGNSGNAHRWIADCLVNCSVYAGKVVGKNLRDLRDFRNQADYDLNRSISAKDASRCYSQAAKMIVDFHSLLTPNDKTKLIQSAEKYAKQNNMI
jgi:uncharacterized protein (UPF0332 family)